MSDSGRTSAPVAAYGILVALGAPNSYNFIYSFGFHQRLDRGLHLRATRDGQPPRTRFGAGSRTTFWCRSATASPANLTIWLRPITDWSPWMELKSREVGIRLTQVAPRCSMRPWWRNTPEIWRSWRRSSAQKRHVGRTWRGCDGRRVSAVRAAVAAGRGRFAECCWSARVVAAKLR